MTDADPRLAKTTRIGRQPDNDLISIGHATFRLSGGELRLDVDESPGSSETSGPAQ